MRARGPTAADTCEPPDLSSPAGGARPHSCNFRTPADQQTHDPADSTI